MKVLFVDDEDDIRELIEIAIMNETDIDATFAASGYDALAALDQEVFDMILLDVTMPPPDGLAVLRTAREKPELTGTKVVMCTARTSKESENEFRLLGADDIIHKPFKPLKLARYIRSIS